MLNKRGQLTLFIILAIVVIAIIILVFVFWKDIKIFVGIKTNPQKYVEDCVSKYISEAKEQIGLKGGSMSPESFALYKGQEIAYLCYTNEYYKTCINQQPLLKQHVEKEIKNYVEPYAKECLKDLKSQLEREGKRVSIENNDFHVEIIPGSMNFKIGNKIIISENEESKVFDSFEFKEPSHFYELIMIGTSIINWEAHYGDSESTVYMGYYPDIKVEKKKQSDGTTIYLLTHRKSKEKFNFASRGLVFPPGYRAEETLI